MRRWLLLSIMSCGVLLFGRTQSAKAQTPPTSTKTATVTSGTASGLSAEELELARYLDVLSDMELLEDLEMLELLPFLEDDDEN